MMRTSDGHERLERLIDTFAPCVTGASSSPTWRRARSNRSPISAEVIWNAGPRLSIRHDSGSSVRPDVDGALLAIRRVSTLVGVHRGLDTVLDLNSRQHAGLEGTSHRVTRFVYVAPNCQSNASDLDRAPTMERGLIRRCYGKARAPAISGCLASGSGPSESQRS